MTETHNNSISFILHELRSPINTVIGLVDLANKSLSNNVEIEDCLRKIKNVSNYMLCLSNNLLEVFKNESVNMKSKVKDFNLDDLIDDVKNIFEIQTSLKKIDFIVQKVGTSDYNLNGDEVQLMQVLINLLSNAVKFTPEKGRVELVVAAIPKGKKIELNLNISDTGIGMNRKTLKKVFKPYIQESSGIYEIYGGTGLGLTIVKNNVAKLGGKINVISEVGKGTSFNIVFDYPLSQEKFINTYNFSGKKILVVDDSEINTEIVKDFLQNTGIDIDVANNGSEAFEKFASSKENTYDFILMDIRMPGMDGCEATKLIRNLNREDSKTVKIIAFSSNGLDKDVSFALDCGMDGYLLKPVKCQALHKTLQSYIGS